MKNKQQQGMAMQIKFDEFNELESVLFQSCNNRLVAIRPQFVAAVGGLDSTCTVYMRNGEKYLLPISASDVLSKCKLKTIPKNLELNGRVHFVSDAIRNVTQKRDDSGYVLLTAVSIQGGAIFSLSGNQKGIFRKLSFF